MIQVTLVHSGERVLEFLGNKASEKTHKWLKSEKVELILNDRYRGILLAAYYADVK